jgi:hypothetical protein
MKKYHMGGGILLLLILTATFFFSCKKNLHSEDVANIDATAKNTNQELISALIKGNVSSTTENGPVSSSTNNPTNPSGSDYSVVLVNSMLKFNSADGMLNFLGALDTTITHWDNNLDRELQGLASEKPYKKRF